MYLHLGGDTVILLSDVIGIFDMDNSTVTRQGRDYLTAAQKRGDVVTVSYELPRSFVVCRDKTRESGVCIYVSQLSSGTLLKRTNALETEKLEGRF